MASSGEEIRNYRVKKLELLKKAGVNPYPAKLPFAVSEIISVKENFKKLASAKKLLGVAGRILAKREHGGSMFLDIFDGSASLTTSGTGKLQLFLGKDKIGADSYRLFSEAVDIGDFAAFQGKAFFTKRREPTVEISRWEMLAKSLLPLPEKWHGLQDAEERFRKRYLDLIMNTDVRQRFQIRTNVIREIRSFLDQKGFEEVETPILQPLPGGALARPFITHHNALDIDLYLRIAPELYLKRLVMGGYNKIYEIAKVFRNEGIDATHTPEYTLLEFYAAYWDENEMMACVEDMFLKIIKKTNKNIFEYNGKKISCKKNFPRITFKEVLSRHALIIDYEKESEDSLKLRALQFGIDIPKNTPKGKIADEIFDKICRPHLQNPTFVTALPVDISPLSKRALDNSTVLRFNLIVGGIEIADGWAELNDPEEQRARFLAHKEMRAKGEEEAHSFDEDFLEAIEQGMPPTAGVGFGVDRLTMLLTDTHNIKEVILFPTMKPK